MRGALGVGSGGFPPPSPPRRWIPAYAGMTGVVAGMMGVVAGMTGVVAGMTGEGCGDDGERMRE